MSPHKVRLTRMEQEIENKAHEYVPVGKDEYERIVQAIERRKKDAVLSIRINQQDLESLKQKAKKLGVKYQTFIAEILRKVAHA